MKKDLHLWQRIFRGVVDGRKAFIGPHTAQIDLTDKCNNTCIGCWVHSPLLDKEEIFPQGEREIPFNFVKQLIKQLCKLGTKEIIFSGSGEPFLYPQIKEVIRLIKSGNISLNIITNASLITDAMAGFLVKNKVDLLTASVWAGSSEVYLNTHPRKKQEDFRRIADNLKRLAFYKKKHNSLVPHVKIYNVICNRNNNDIVNMIEFAREVDADSVEFQAIDTIKGKTDSLALNSTQSQEVFNQFQEIRERRDMVFYDTALDTPLAQFCKNEFSDFGKLWKDFQEKFQLSRFANELICPKGYRGKRENISHLDIHKKTEIGSFKYSFLFGKDCLNCNLNKSCFEKDRIRNREVNLLNILNVGTVLRRFSWAQHKEPSFDAKVDSIPCYIGWYYVRILTDGKVIPCCKAAQFSLGNIFQQNFKQIWSSHSYREFRFNAKNLSKSEPYFSKINCLKSCDNWGMNSEIHDRITKANINIDTVQVNEKKALTTDKYLIIKAKDFVRGNLNPGYGHAFGGNLVIDGGEKQGFAEYEFNVEFPQKYDFWSRYASGNFRPVDIYLDGKLVKKNGLDKNTGGWTRKYLKFCKEVAVSLTKGKHILKICSTGCIPHIEKFCFVKENHLTAFLKERQRTSYLRLLNQQISNRGWKNTLRRTSYWLAPRPLRDRYLEILGIYDGKYGYKGPFHVQIDLSNNCNNSCIACWCNSPLLKEKRLSDEEKRQYLPLGLARELLDEVYRMGATEVYFSGSGEPFMHPQIIKVLEFAKKKNLICHVNTNFTLLDKKKIDCLIDLGVDFLTVSVWAGTPEVYRQVHPGRTEQDFYSLKESLMYLNKKKKEKTGRPFIKVYNVIFNMNYAQLEEMIRFAEHTQSESIEFTVADTVPDSTDILCLNHRQSEELAEVAKGIKRKLDRNSKLPSGVLLFQFDQFLRRVSITADVKEAKYDRNIIDSMPCYIGWLFARIIPSGEVHSCLKAHRVPTGSLYLNRFSEIWNSRRQVDFRKKALQYKKDDPFFKMIGNDPGTSEAGCYKSCDDIGRNFWMHRRIQALTLPERLLLKTIAKTLKVSRRIKPKVDQPLHYHRDPTIAGIIHGRKAFVGPEQVVIDPTNRCNLRCLSCWLYSPLLTKDKPAIEWLKKELPKEMLIKLIDDLASLGTKRIRFTGGGEPFMHKDLMEVIEHASKKNVSVAITTNFGLISEENVRRLISLGIKELCVSIWASNPTVYNAVHPHAPSNYFEKLKQNLTLLKETKNPSLRVTFANVITNVNYQDFEQMYEFGLTYSADAAYFTIVDVFTDQTDKLLLDEQQRRELVNKAARIKQRNSNDKMELEFFDGFLRRISMPQKDFAKGEYDKCDVNKIPCYVGWIFSRVLADGNVVPCCRGAKKVMGNINQKSFSDIWFSQLYNEFRAKAKYLSKDNAYFNEIGCLKECDNLMHNEQMDKKIRGLLA